MGHGPAGDWRTVIDVFSHRSAGWAGRCVLVGSSESPPGSDWWDSVANRDLLISPWHDAHSVSAG